MKTRVMLAWIALMIFYAKIASETMIVVGMMKQAKRKRKGFSMFHLRRRAHNRIVLIEVPHVSWDEMALASGPYLVMVMWALLLVLTVAIIWPSDDYMSNMFMSQRLDKIEERLEVLEMEHEQTTSKDNVKP